MAQPDNLETRLTALETEVRQLADRVRASEQDAAAARVLAGGADRDVAEIRGEIREFREQNTRVLNAMREDLADLRQHVDAGFEKVDARFGKVNAEFEKVNAEFGKVNAEFTEMRGKLDATAAGQQQIVGLLNTLIAQGGQQVD